MIGNLMWAVTLASLGGTIANIYKRRWCFWVWLFTNALWTAYDLWLGAWAQAALMGTYTVLAVWGLIRWKRLPQEPAGV